MIPKEKQNKNACVAAAYKYNGQFPVVLGKLVPQLQTILGVVQQEIMPWQ